MRMRFRIALLMGIAVLMAGAAGAGRPIALKDLDVAQTVRAPRAVQGVAIVEGQIVTIDARGQFVTIRPSDQRAIRQVRSTVTAARVLATDGRVLWVAGSEPYTVHRVDAANGSVLDTIRIPPLKTTSPTSIGALAWDGKSLWAGIAAGWSSTIVRIDPRSGLVTQSFYAEGIPRGLASDGKYLWIAKDNGANPSVLARWTISDDANAMARSRVYVARLPGHDPTGLAYDQKALWYADQKAAAFQRLQLPPER